MFAEAGADAPLEEIARRAGVGIGTLYRHFPAREAILSAVYQREVDQLAVSAETLLASRSALEALEAWMNLLVDYLATKRVVAPALRASAGEGAQLYAASGVAITSALNRLVSAAVGRGEIRHDITPDDVLRLILGVSNGYDQPGWEASARRLIGVLIAGLRAAPSR